jgi:dihydroorotate dehydrogenase electron transfer subunit
MAYMREIATVLANDADGDARLLQLSAPAIAAAACPFQFVLVKIPGGDFILRRPLSVFDAREDEIALLVRPVGEGTARICCLVPGENLDLTGPFGREFDVPADALFVAGGIGVAGLFFALAEAARSGRKAELLCGAKNAAQLYARYRLEELGVEATFVTEDGSSGSKGLATEYLPGVHSVKEKLISAALDEKLPPYPKTVITCGPRPMYVVLHKILGEDARLHVLMEERMACGVGACLSCAVPAREPKGSYIAACEEGPLIDASLVDWNRLEGEV